MQICYISLLQAWEIKHEKKTSPNIDKVLEIVVWVSSDTRSTPPGLNVSPTCSTGRLSSTRCPTQKQRASRLVTAAITHPHHQYMLPQTKNNDHVSVVSRNKWNIYMHYGWLFGLYWLNKKMTVDTSTPIINTVIYLWILCPVQVSVKDYEKRRDKTKIYNN